MQGYLNYLKESLQLEDFILPLRPLNSTQEPQSIGTPLIKTSPLAFFILSENELNTEAMDLLKKMTSAMGYSLEDLHLQFVNEEVNYAELPPAIKVAVLFTPDERATQIGFWDQFHHVSVIRTYSPELLLKKPALKKPTWSHLQNVMAALKSS